MMGRSHMIIGACTGAISSHYIWENPTPENILLSVPAAAFGALLTDIDHPKSTLISKPPVFNLILIPISQAISKIFGHRGITHSLIGILLILGYALYLNSEKGNIALKPYIFVIISGYLSHIISDALTFDGVPLFYPFIRTKFNLIKTTLYIPFFGHVPKELLMKTGGKGETFCVGIFILFTAYFIGSIYLV